MASSLAAQLSQIARTSTHSLNLKAQKAAHSQSLLFDPTTAATQDISTIYALCIEGFQELCLLDRRFVSFGKSIFSEQSKAKERTQMTKAENEELSIVLEDFLGLVGAKLLLKPAIKALEWLVRRFRIQEYNTGALLLTFLPYHTTTTFRVVLSILPQDLPQAFKFLHPYIQSRMPPPRHTIIYNLINNHAFTSAFNSYVLRVCKLRYQHHGLLTFWASSLTEAVSGILDQAQSGRKGIHVRNEQDALIRLLPVLNEGLVLRKVPELRKGCYMILIVLASKATLSDDILTKMMEAVVAGWTRETTSPGLVCLALLAERRDATTLPKALFNEIIKLENLSTDLEVLSHRYRVGRLSLSLVLGSIDELPYTTAPELLDFIEKTLESPIMSDSQVTQALISLLNTMQHLADETASQRGSQMQLVNMLMRLCKGKTTGPLLMNALENLALDMDALEMRLQANIRPPESTANKAAQDSDMPDLILTPELSNAFQEAMTHLPERELDEVSFLSHQTSRTFPKLAHAFMLAVGSPDSIEEFSKLPLLRGESALTQPLYYSFFIRIWCGPYPVQARRAALNVVSRTLASQPHINANIQILIPYIIAALADPSSAVRKSATELLLACSVLFKKPPANQKEYEQPQPWSVDDIYGPAEVNMELRCMSMAETRRIISAALIPDLEEYVLDNVHVIEALKRAFQASSAGSLTNAYIEAKSLKTSQKVAFFAFLASHVSNTPILRVQLNLLKMLNRIDKVGGLSRTTMLLPLLQNWINKATAGIAEDCKAEEISPEDLEGQMVEIVTPRDDEGLATLIAIPHGQVGERRPGIMKAVMMRFQNLWPSLREDFKISACQAMLRLCLDTVQDSSVHLTYKSEAVDFLKSVPLSTDTLLAFLHELPTADNVQDSAVSVKRRKISQTESKPKKTQAADAFLTAITDITFVLELTDSSRAAYNPRLMEGLFNMVGELQRFKAQAGSELAYLQCLTLGSLLEMTKSLKGPLAKQVDRSAIRIDLIVDCVRSTSSQQVHNAALLLIAHLAEVVPDLVLHSVMPIFTFMGQTLLQQDDEYSIYVIDQTLQRVIPPLVQSLKKRNQDPVAGTAELLLSFTAALEHIPARRRLHLFTSLVHTLGEEDFLFAVLCMLADKQEGNDDARAFAVQLAAHYEPYLQLITARKYLGVVVDVLNPTRTISRILFGPSSIDNRSVVDVAFNLLILLKSLLSSPSLAAKISNFEERNATGRTQVALTELLEQLLYFTESARAELQLNSAANDCLETLLSILSTAELIVHIESLLDKPDEELRLTAIKALKPRIEDEKQNEKEIVAAIINLIPRLTSILTSSTNSVLKLATIACLDSIIGKYGKIDIETVTTAAQVIAGSDGLGDLDQRIQVISLICLSSTIAVTGAGSTPFLAQAIPLAITHLQTNMAQGLKNPKLYDVVYSFLGVVLDHVPWMMTAQILDKVLEISHKSAVADLGSAAEESRQLVFHLIAGEVSPKDCAAAIKRTIAGAIAAGPLALKEHLAMFNVWVEKHSKSITVKHAETLADIVLEAYDLRKVQGLGESNNYTSDDVKEVEDILNDITIKIILKLNDSVFRPIFVRFIEWATVDLRGKEKNGRIFRSITIFRLLEKFFDTLKSIVTSYATHIIEAAVKILSNVSTDQSAAVELWGTVLRTLRQTFEHDQDGFWQSPAHFNAIHSTLLSQFEHAAILPVTDEVIPAVTELAGALDAGDHQKEMNTAILKHMRSEDPQVRLAAIKCEESLTTRLGEDWLALLPEMLPFISDVQEDDDESVEQEAHRWILQIEGVLGESLDSMLQ